MQMKKRLPGQRPGKAANPKRSKNKKNRNSKRGPGNNGHGRNQNQVQNFNSIHYNPPTMGVCQKCGQPARDGKLCDFHRNLLNAVRSGFR